MQLAVSVWPTVEPGSDTFDELRTSGHLVQDAAGGLLTFPWPSRSAEEPMRPMAYYDATLPGARAALWQRLNDNYRSLGVGCFWLDACEPDVSPAVAERAVYAAGPAAEVANLYPLLHTRAVADGLRAAGDDRPLSLVRSAWAGSQKYGAALWCGDIPPTFGSLARQIRAGLNVAMSGIPWWNTDIGGFSGGDPDDPAYRELLIRWFQFGTFSPVMRLHGDRLPHYPDFCTEATGGPNEVWSYGEGPQIVVNTNAPELLRRQLGSRRWQGDHIAMGTNVDCYQRAEGHYGLMPGIISALRDHANPLPKDLDTAFTAVTAVVEAAFGIKRWGSPQAPIRTPPAQPVAGNSFGGIDGPGSSRRSDARRFSSRNDVSHGHKSGNARPGQANSCSIRHRCSTTGGHTPYTVTRPSDTVIHRRSAGTVCASGSIPGSSITQSLSSVATRSCGSPQNRHVNVVVSIRDKPSSAPMSRGCTPHPKARQSANWTNLPRRAGRQTTGDGTAGGRCMHRPPDGRPRSEHQRSKGCSDELSLSRPRPLHKARHAGDDGGRCGVAGVDDLCGHVSLPVRRGALPITAAAARSALSAVAGRHCPRDNLHRRQSRSRCGLLHQLGPAGRPIPQAGGSSARRPCSTWSSSPSAWWLDQGRWSLW